MKLGMQVRLGPGHTVLDGAQFPSPKKGTQTPNFRPMSIVAKRSPILATAVHLFVCASNISGKAEMICAKFTEKTCLVRRSDESECQGQRSKVKVTREKNALCTAITPGSDEMERAGCK